MTRMNSGRQNASNRYGKERHSLYSSIEDEEEDEELMPRRESVLDYLDDEDEA